MLRVSKPKNARSKRVFEKRQPKEVENSKTAIFVRGLHSSPFVSIALKELSALKKPDSISFSKKNDIAPFQEQGTASIEFWASKNDASLFVVGNSQKKRKDNLVWARVFDGKVLDLLEMGITDAKSMEDFKGGNKPSLGLRPLFHFSGPQFGMSDENTDEESGGHPAYQHLKSLLLDFYRGEELANVQGALSATMGGQLALSGIQHVVCVTAAPGGPTGNAKEGQDADLAALYAAAAAVDGSANTTIDTSGMGGVVHFRVYSISLLASGTRQPRVELTECGPSFDFVLRRRRPATTDMMTQALRRPKTAAEKNTQGRKRKNIDTDEMGDMVGRLHVGKQDLTSLQTRKMKGLKEGRDPLLHKEADDSDEEARFEEDDEEELEFEGEEDSGADDDEDEDDDDEDEAFVSMEVEGEPSSEGEEVEVTAAPPKSKKSRRG